MQWKDSCLLVNLRLKMSIFENLWMYFKKKKKKSRRANSNSTQVLFCCVTNATTEATQN